MGIPVAVYGIGTLTTGDTVKVDGTGQILTVEVTTDTELLLGNQTPTAVSFSAGDRFLPVSPRPAVYKDPFGNVSLGSTISTDPATGRASVYVENKRFDYVVTGSGLSPRVYVDAEGGEIRTPPRWVNVKDYRTVQDAVDAAEPSVKAAERGDKALYRTGAQAAPRRSHNEVVDLLDLEKWPPTQASPVQVGNVARQVAAIRLDRGR